MRLFWLTLVSFFAWPLLVGLGVILFLAKRLSKRNVLEKLGFLQLPPPTATKAHVWLHVSSLGEWNTAKPFIRALKRSDAVKNRLKLLITGFNEELLPVLQESTLPDAFHFLPLENRFAYQRLLRHYRVQKVVLVEMELWPLWIECLKQEGLPIYLVNAALFKKERRRYQDWAWIFKPCFKALEKSYVVSEAVKKNFLRLGVNAAKVQVMGNFKFDFEPLPGSAALRAVLAKALQEKRRLITLGSFHYKEFTAVFSPLEEWFLKREYLFILAPRKLEELSRWEAFLKRQQLSFTKKTALKNKASTPALLLLDVYGELHAAYHSSEVVLVGGSFLPIGGHNLLEPLSVGTGRVKGTQRARWVVVGPHTFHLREVVTALREELVVVERDQLKNTLKRLLRQRGTATLKRRREKLATLQGASERTVAALFS